MCAVVERCECLLAEATVRVPLLSRTPGLPRGQPRESAHFSAIDAGAFQRAHPHFAMVHTFLASTRRLETTLWHPGVLQQPEGAALVWLDLLHQVSAGLCCAAMPWSCLSLAGRDLLCDVAGFAGCGRASSPSSWACLEPCVVEVPWLPGAVDKAQITDQQVWGKPLFGALFANEIPPQLPAA